jgi:hypothetical protein
MAKHDEKGGRKKGRGTGDDAPSMETATAKPGERLQDRVAGGHAADSGGSGGHHPPAGAHGLAATVDASLPASRDELIALHAEARRRRAEAPLGSDAYRQAADEIGRIEVRIAAVERAQDPPRG